MPASEQGVNLERYMLVPRTLIFITRGDRVLLLQGAEDKRLWAGLYNGVGGHVEQGEDVLSAAKREVLEETGLVDARLWLCGTITIDTQLNPGVGVFVFKGECDSEEVRKSDEGFLKWVHKADILQLALVSDLRVLLPKILEMNRGDEPFSARSYYDTSGQLITIFC
jgi:8-oxo-dGTP diphosphatase